MTIGRIDVDALERHISDEVLAVSVMAVNSEIGTIQNIAHIAEFTSRSGSLLHCDSAQAPCAMDLSGLTDCVDMMSISSHKMYGPMGIGALYVRRDLHKQIEPLVYGGGQQNGIRSGTLPTALCVGFGEAAVQAGSESTTNERPIIARRRDRFVEGLLTLPHKIWMNGPVSGPERHPGNANICFEGLSAHAILGALQPDISASTGSACASGMNETSHVLRAIGLSDVDAESAVRFSLGRHTTDRDVDIAIELIGRAIKRLQNSANKA